MPKAVNTRSIENSTEPAPAKGPVDKAMEVLEALVQAGGPHRLGDIARRTGLTKPTVHRHLRTLAEYGFAEPADGGSYRAGPRLLGLAAAALDDLRDLRLVRPALADLRRRTGHVAHYAVRHGADAVYLEQSEPARAYRMNIRPGDRTPLHCAAVGLAMLSALSADERDAVLDGATLVARTPHTLTGPADLRVLLRSSAERGYWVGDEYDEPDVRSVAAPVLDADGRVMGAIGVAGLTFTLTPESAETYGPMVRAAARSVSGAPGIRTPALVALDGSSGTAGATRLGGEGV